MPMNPMAKAMGVPMNMRVMSRTVPHRPCGQERHLDGELPQDLGQQYGASTEKDQQRQGGDGIVVNPPQFRLQGQQFRSNSQHDHHGPEHDDRIEGPQRPFEDYSDFMSGEREMDLGDVLECDEHEQSRAQGEAVAFGDHPAHEG